MLPNNTDMIKKRQLKGVGGPSRVNGDTIIFKIGGTHHPPIRYKLVRRGLLK